MLTINTAVAYTRRTAGPDEILFAEFIVVDGVQAVRVGFRASGRDELMEVWETAPGVLYGEW